MDAAAATVDGRTVVRLEHTYGRSDTSSRASAHHTGDSYLLIMIVSSVGMSVSTSGSERFARSGQTTGTRLELWVRPSAVEGNGVGHLVEQARALEREGHVDAVTVRMWDEALDLSSDLRNHREREARAHVQAFKRWAWQNGTEIRGFGERRRAARGRMGPEYVTQRVPRALLAEYEDDVLVNVTPCDSRERCVSQRLDAIEAEAEATQYSTPRSRIIR
jgi:hypothetical protein